MEAPTVHRRLAAILAADIAGYSRLMAEDEEATLRTLAAYRSAISDLVAAHGGRIFGTAGDSVIIEFASAVNSVRAGVAIQRALERRNADLPSGRRMEFRIGINVGDVVEQDGDIFGDGVNIAARLEGLAEPGGICVSERVQEDTAGKVGLTFEDIGAQTLKNIARPVHAYRLRLDGAVAAAVTTSTVRPALSLPDKPSIAVLPFQNMSGDTEQEYFADGVVEDVITALSRFKSFAVIARHSSFVYKGRAVDLRQVGRELGVRYVLEGSVRRSGERLRITAQLVDSTSGAHLWADKFEGTIKDVFDVQDRITESVATIVAPQIREAEIEHSRRERPGSVAAYDLYLQALSKFRATKPDESAAAYALISQAIALEPNNGVFLALALQTLESRFIMGWSRLTNDDRALCRDLVHRALDNSRDDASVLKSCGLALLSPAREYDLGFATLQRAVALNPNDFLVLFGAGVGNLHCGSPEDALTYFHHALRLSPASPDAFVVLSGIAHVQMILGNYAEALSYAERSFTINASFNPTYWVLIAANAQLGRLVEARRFLEAFRKIAPGVTIASMLAGHPAKDPSRMAAIIEGLRLAGLDEG